MTLPESQCRICGANLHGSFSDHIQSGGCAPRGRLRRLEVVHRLVLKLPTSGGPAALRALQRAIRLAQTIEVFR